MEKEQINLSINDGDPFFAHEVTVNFTPTQITFDFKNITPRTDPRSKKSVSFLLKHNVVMVEPWHAKAFYDVMGTVIKKYEKEFGKIDKPAALKKAEKKQKDSLKQANITDSEDVPTYLG